jgi:hypothetical protein
VNCYQAMDPAVPFGGYKMSGYGRESGKQHVEEYLNVKAVWINLIAAVLEREKAPSNELGAFFLRRHCKEPLRRPLAIKQPARHRIDRAACV